MTDDISPRIAGAVVATLVLAVCGRLTTSSP